MQVTVFIEGGILSCVTAELSVCATNSSLMIVLATNIFVELSDKSAKILAR
jgi:hypothetical protein